MQVGLHSWSFRNRFKQEPSFTIFKALDLTAEMGFKSIEIMSGKANMPPGDFASDDLPYLKSVLAYAKDLGITIPCLSTYNDFAYVKDENWRLANIAYIKKWLALAGDLGVPNIRMLTGYNVEGQDRAEPSDDGGRHPRMHPLCRKTRRQHGHRKSQFALLPG